MNLRTVLLRTIPRNGENNNEDLLNTTRGMIKVHKAGYPQGPTLVTGQDLGLDGFQISSHSQWNFSEMHPSFVR